MSNLLETLAAELERPRELPRRVVNYITGTYGVDEEAIGGFLVNELSKLEDDELDLILSPLFTPKLADQVVFAELLGNTSIPREQWPELVRELVSRPTHAQLLTPDNQTHRVTLRDVIIERYVHRLRLEGRISEELVKLLNRIPSSSDAPALKAIARRAVWENEGQKDILVRYLTSVMDRGSYSLEDTLDLLNLVEGRKPANVPDLLARMPAWKEALRQQIEVGGGKPFFHDQIRFMHGGGRDQRQEDPRMSVKEHELEFLKRLEQVLAA